MQIIQENTVTKVSHFRYDEVTKEYPMLDSITGENIIAGLSVTREWKKCFKIFQDLKISCIPNTLAYNSLISATFNHGECVTGWALFQEMIGNCFILFLILI